MASCVARVTWTIAVELWLDSMNRNKKGQKSTFGMCMVSDAPSAYNHFEKEMKSRSDWGRNLQFNLQLTHVESFIIIRWKI
uniref:Uncharacterized protein n=1 Tax=Helianthus annuus TaxID=4232 RepID=A0A251TFA6_HELAN